MKVTVTRGATVNLGNYESARADLTVEFNTDEEASITDVARELNTEVCAWLEEEVANVQEEAGTKPLPVTRFTGRS